MSAFGDFLKSEKGKAWMAEIAQPDQRLVNIERHLADGEQIGMRDVRYLLSRFYEVQGERDRYKAVVEAFDEALKGA